MEENQREEIGECFPAASVAAEKDIAIAKDTGNLCHRMGRNVQIPFGWAWEMKHPWRADYDEGSREGRYR